MEALRIKKEMEEKERLRIKEKFRVINERKKQAAERAKKLWQEKESRLRHKKKLEQANDAHTPSAD